MPSTGNKKNNFQNSFQTTSSTDEANYKKQAAATGRRILKELKMMVSVSPSWALDKFQMNAHPLLSLSLFKSYRAYIHHKLICLLCVKLVSFIRYWSLKCFIPALAPLFPQVSKLQGECYYCYSKWLHKRKKRIHLQLFIRASLLFCTMIFI